MPQSERQPLATTAICDSIRALRSRDIRSFHALPLSRCRSIDASRLRETYESILGEEILHYDQTYTGNVFDTPVMPKRCVEESRRTTALAFGASYTAYVTTGTTTSNFVAIYAMAREGDRVLADRSSHQSIHFALLKNKNRVTYGRIRHKEERSGRAALDVPAFIEEYREAFVANRPYSLVVLCGCSYEGVMYDVRRIMEECLLIHDDVTFLVDEAWFSFAFFHPLYRPYTAMNAAQELRQAYPNKRFSVVATQSAHKSLSSMRQGSYIHVHGDEDAIQRLREAQYKVHTTSPSYPILASLELARAQAVLEGHDLIDNALRLAGGLREKLAHEPALAGYSLNDSSGLVDAYTAIDPLRISIDVSRLTPDVQAFKEHLFREERVYINHVTSTSVLLNVHIGVTDTCIDRVVSGMLSFAAEAPKDQTVAPSDAYIIAYPPGTPLAVPGDAITTRLRQDMARLRASGVEVFVIDR